MSNIHNNNMHVFSSSRNNDSWVPHPCNLSFWLMMCWLSAFTSIILLGFSEEPFFYELFISDLERGADIPVGFSYVPAKITIDPSLLETHTPLGVMDESAVDASPLIQYLIIIRYALALLPYVVFGFFMVSAAKYMQSNHNCKTC